VYVAFPQVNARLLVLNHVHVRSACDKETAVGATQAAMTGIAEDRDDPDGIDAYVARLVSSNAVLGWQVAMATFCPSARRGRLLEVMTVRPRRRARHPRYGTAPDVAPPLRERKR
jgi:hypothetical protein